MRQIVRYDEAGNRDAICEGVIPNDLVFLADGTGYFSAPNHGQIWQFTVDGESRVVDEMAAAPETYFPNGLVTSPDQSLLFAAETRGRFIISWQIQADGTLAHRQVYGHLHLPDHRGDSGADGMTVDTEGRRYVTSHVGIQILDQSGRVHQILNAPGNGWMSNVAFGGPELDTLYVTSMDKVFRRKINAKGLGGNAMKPPKPRL